MAGYSARSLADKLGIKEGYRVAVLGAPPQYATILGKLPPQVSLGRKLQGEKDFLHFFTTSRRELKQTLPALKSHLAQNGMPWIS